MNLDTPTTSPDPEEEDEVMDDPYIHTVSTEEFGESVERASHQEDELNPNKD